MDAESSGASGPGIMPPPEFLNRGPRLPARVNFAMEVVEWANSIEQGYSRPSPHGPETMEGRSLTEAEKAVYGSALEVIRLYLTGEMSFTGEAQGGYEDDDPAKDVECFFCRNKKSEKPS